MPPATTSAAAPDPEQARVVRHRGGVMVVLGAPGTGKTSVLTRQVQDRIGEGLTPDECLVVAATRQGATRLRGAIGRDLGATHTEPLARTAASLAFAILRLVAARDREPMPRLISGAEQDTVLRELLAGHEETGGGPPWPADLDLARSTAGFRGQLRDLLMRAVEHGVGPAELEHLAEVHGRPEWACAGALLEEYDQVTALADPGSYDPAWICTAAAEALETDDDLRATVHAKVRFIGVDDAQELTASAARMLDAVRPDGADALLVGDPDAALLGFRGAVPALFLDLAGRWAGDAGPETVALRRRPAGAPAVGAVSDRVAQRIGVAGSALHREPASAGPAGSAGVQLTRSAAQEATLVARWLRHAHLVDGVPWDGLAVIARSGRQQDSIRRALASGGVPVHVDRSSVPLGSDPAVQPLLLAFDIVTRADETQDWWVGPEEALELLRSPLGGSDPVALRRLRRLLRGAELVAGGSRRADDLLAWRMADPDLRRSVPEEVPAELEPVVRVARVLDAGRAAYLRGLGQGPGDEGAGLPSGGPDEVLWALWSSSGLATGWARQALGGGALGARADRDLDAVMVLFSAAESYAERLPGARPRSFLDSVRSAEVAADTLVVGGRRPGAVEVLTPHAAAGRRWQRVAVVGVQDGVWPDLRLRDTLLGADALVAALQGRAVSGPQAWREAQAQVRADELRQFHVAVSRASEHLLVTAASSPDDQPSGLLELVEPGFRERAPVEVPPPMTLRGLVGELRRAAVQAHRRGDLATRDEAVDVLHRLSTEHVPGADPSDWWSLRETSTSAMIRPQGSVRVSPSRLQTYLDCELRWFLTSRGADTGEAPNAQLGTLVHEVVAQAPEAPVADLVAELDRRWPDLNLVDGWVADKTRRDAHAMLERYAGYVAAARAEGRELLGTELELSVRLDARDGDPTQEDARDAHLVGAVDRLERAADGSLVVADLKTGRTPVPRADVERHAQLAAYQVAVSEGAFAELGSRSGGARLVQLGTSGAVDRAQPSLEDSPEPDRARQQVRAAAAGMAGAEFTARDLERRCRRCPARFACPIQPEGSQR
ncbi:ATP-dependent DNA helicase [Serinicoccus kebangsaanensis]|uniref:ATP-dependent DNA helicase n=1 Tax=Serinicoccus kebangsaanensis TaxID=2602069 RepID=UPI00178C2EED|nr:ATP-dependent DNA helicase [Serinicoccus kebangsaanensis]